MTGNYAYTPAIWPPFLTVLLLVVLSAYSWRRRKVSGALYFSIGSLLTALWVAGYAMEYAAVDVATKIFWIKFQAAWQLPATSAVVCFILEYTWPGRWITRRALILLSIAPLLFLVLILTNDLHHLAWRGFAFDGSVIPQRGLGSWVLITYGMLLALVQIGALCWLFIHSPQHRWSVAFILAGLVGARTLYLLGAVRIVRPDLPIEVFLIAYLFSMYAIAFFGFHILDPIPLARRTVLEQLQDGMLVLEPQGRVASSNPAAERILGLTSKEMKGKPIRQLLPDYPDEPLTDPCETKVEFSLGVGKVGSRQDVRHYLMRISPLVDWRGLEAGHLLILRDVTERKQAEVQLLEQERALAILHERERLARELHDSLGQALAATHLQVGAVKLLFDRGEEAKVSECLDILDYITLQAEADMREYLLGTQTAISADHSFFAALREFQGRFTRQYNLPVELSLPPGLEEQGLPQTAAIQLLRIIQEALSNVRKHAGATSACVVFSVSGDLLQIDICDDGQGFDPTAITAKLNGGYGLRSMRERAEELGGCIEVISQPGQGTQIMVKVPVNREM